MRPKQRNTRADRPTDPKDAAEKMADAVSYLCRVAAEEGLYVVLPDLIEARLKLEMIATADDPHAERLD